jgi:hypothetical protein
VIQRLCDAVAMQSAKWAYITPLMVLVWGRLRRMSRRFASLVARMEAGRLKPPRASVQNPDPGRPRPPRPPPPWPPFPSSPGWLLHYVQLEAAATANLIRHMLEHDPEMRALLEAAPQLGRILRPLLRMVSPAPLPTRLIRSPRPAPSLVTPNRVAPDPVATNTVATNTVATNTVAVNRVAPRAVVARTDVAAADAFGPPALSPKPA